MKNATDQNEVDLAELNEEEFQQWLQNKYPGRTVRHNGDNIVVSIPVKFYRRNGRQMIQSNTGTNVGQADNGQDDNKTLITAIVKAYAWQEELESGEFSSVEELAKAKGIGRTYVGRILKLTSLAPDIVESILAGDESHGLSLRLLHKGIPDSWDEQRHLGAR